MKRRVVVPLLAMLVAGCAGATHTEPRSAVRTAAAGATPGRVTVKHGPSQAPAASFEAHIRTAARLPQTRVLPPSAGREFDALMAALWSGIVGNAPARAAIAFFPKDAYVQLKAVAGAGGDWENRLFHEYALDLAAAHSLLGPGAAGARLQRVSVPTSYAHWVQPGACYNRLGYFEVPNARILYSENGTRRSFGIASMISWRGVWFVVHLGAVLREGRAGTVDEPASGPGSSAPSGTC